MQRHTVSGRTALLVGLSALFGVICFVYRFLTFRGFSNDHYEHLARAQQMLLGDLPVRDFNQPGWPLMDGVSAAAQFFLGRTLFSEVLLVFGCLGLASALTFWITGRLTGSIAIAAVMTLLQILVSPRSYSYPKLLLYPIAFGAINWYVAAPGRTRTIVLAAVTSASFLMRHDHGLFVGAGCAIAIVMAHWRPPRPGLVRALGAYSIATIAILSPYLLYVQWAGGLRSYFRDAIAYSTAEARTRRVVVPAFALDIGRAVARQERVAVIYIRWAEGVDDAARLGLERQFQISPVQAEGNRTWRYRISNVSRPMVQRIVRHPLVEDTEGIDRGAETVDPDRFADACVLCIGAGPGLHAEQNAETWLYYLSWMAVFGGLTLAVLHRHAAAAAPLGALTLMTALAAVSFQRIALDVRVPDMWGLLPMLLGVVLGALWHAHTRRCVARTSVVIVLLATTAAVAVIGNVREEFNVAGLTTGGQTVVDRFREVAHTLLTPPPPLPRPEEATEGSLHTYVAVCTAPQDRVLVFATMPQLFYESRRGFAAGYYGFTLDFQNSDIEQRVGIARWRTQSVPLAFVHEHDLPLMTKSFRLLVAEMQRRYALAYQFDAVNDRGPLLVFAERSRLRTGTYRPLGAPCYNQAGTTETVTRGT
jgi:hypothetical protein